ncbi:hypothetical protein JVU11DRAFT_6228 [Chiua virens]|nr:hypothetical protein JVU11DRAFT_6228 [Chiua virens]
MTPLAATQSKTQKYNSKHVLDISEEIWKGFPGPEAGGSIIFKGQPQPEAPQTLLPESLPDFTPLNPPIMKFTYPPKSSDGEELRDLKLFDKMLSELEREQAYLKEWVKKGTESITTMFRQSGLARAEVDAEVDEWQSCLNMISSIGGSKLTTLWDHVDEEVCKRFQTRPPRKATRTTMGPALLGTPTSPGSALDARIRKVMQDTLNPFPTKETVDIP